MEFETHCLHRYEEIVEFIKDKMERQTSLEHDLALIEEYEKDKNTKIPKDYKNKSPLSQR